MFSFCEGLTNAWNTVTLSALDTFLSLISRPVHLNPPKSFKVRVLDIAVLVDLATPGVTVVTASGV